MATIIKQIENFIRDNNRVLSDVLKEIKNISAKHLLN